MWSVTVTVQKQIKESIEMELYAIEKDVIAKAMAFEYLMANNNSEELESLFRKMNLISHAVDFNNISEAITYARYVDIKKPR